MDSGYTEIIQWDTRAKCRTEWVPNQDARKSLLGGVLKGKPTLVEKVGSSGKLGVGGGMGGEYTYQYWGLW